jgi:hypothetical protein
VPLKVVLSKVAAQSTERPGFVLERFQERVEPLGADRRGACVKPIAVA